MTRGARLPLGLRPLAAAALALAIVASAAVAVVVFAGYGLEATALIVAAACACTACTLAWLQSARLDGSLLCLRTLATGFAPRPLHARTIGALQFRRSPGPRRLRYLNTDGVCGHTLVLCARDADNAAFRALTLWLIVHGRRGAQIDAALLDALAVVHEPAGAGQPHDTSHA